MSAELEDCAQERRKPMRRWSFGIVACVIGLTTVVIGQAAAVLAAEFYKDKRLRIIVPFSPGGGFDIYSRLIASHMGKHIPGNPTFIVQNMPGGGGIIGPTYVYNVAKPDGLTSLDMISLFLIDVGGVGRLCCKKGESQ